MHRIIAGLGLLFVLVPSIAFASYAENAASAKQKAADLTPAQLDSLNVKTFSDAYLTGRIIGYDRAEFDRLVARVDQLEEENAALRAAGPADIGSAAVSDTDLLSLEERVTKLERMFVGLQDSLVLLLNMVSEALNFIRQ